MNYNNRDEVPEEYKWDLSTRYKDINDWEKDLEKVKKDINKISKYKKKLLESSDSLYNALELKFKLIVDIQKLYCYAHCMSDEDIENNKYFLMLSEVESLFQDFAFQSAYITPEILKGKKSTITNYLKEEKLKKYEFYLNNLLRQKKHQLNEREEQIISKLTSTNSNYETMSNILTNSVIDYGHLLVDGTKTQLLNSNYRTIITNKNRETRKEAFNMLTSNLKKYENIYSINLISSMKQAKNIADIYKFKSVLDMDLFESNIPKKVYENLYETIEKRLDVYHKYYNMIKRSLGLEELEYYDKDSELVNTEMTFSIEDTKILLLNSLSILGDEYTDILEKAFNERWIDFGVYKGKTSSIYATCNYGDHPLVLTNFLGKFTDISTLAHELGHAVHFHLSMDNPYHDWYTDLYTAEVASLTNEILFSNYVINNSKDKDLKLTAIYNTLNTIQNNLFDAALEGEFEHKVYNMLEEGKELNTEIFNKLIYDIRKKYYGNSINLNENISTMWTRRMHYFRPYYLFKYATGVSSAIYISKKILSGDDKFKEKYLNFLKKGGSNYPHELLLEMGVDLTKPEVINEAIDYMEELIIKFNKISEE